MKRNSEYFEFKQFSLAFGSPKISNLLTNCIEKNPLVMHWARARFQHGYDYFLEEHLQTDSVSTKIKEDKPRFASSDGAWICRATARIWPAIFRIPENCNIDTLKKGRGFKREKGKIIFFITRLLKRADKLPVHWMRRRFAKGKRRDRVWWGKWMEGRFAGSRRNSVGRAEACPEQGFLRTKMDPWK